MPKVYLGPRAQLVRLVPRDISTCAAVQLARGRALHSLFITSQVTHATSQISICEITSYVVTCDCSIIKIIRTDTTSLDLLAYRKAGLGGEPHEGETPPDLPVLTS